MTEGRGNPQGIGNVLRQGTKFVRTATDGLDGLGDKPTGDDPPPFRFDYVSEQLNLLRTAVAVFEQNSQRGLQVLGLEARTSTRSW